MRFAIAMIRSIRFVALIGVLFTEADCFKITHNVLNISFYSADAMGAAVGSNVIFALGKTSASLSKAAAILNTTDLSWTVHPDAFTTSRAQQTAVADGTQRYVMFAGGEDGNKSKFSLVELYDFSTGTFSTMSTGLAVPRSFLASTTIGQYTLFGGGEIEAGTTGTDSSCVDIWDSTKSSWSTHLNSGGNLLSHPRKKLAAASAGQYALFGGGYTSGEKDEPHRGYRADVDIFNASNGNWTTATLSQPRQYIVAANAGTKAVFAGGFCSPCLGQNNTSRSNVADVFDSETLTWSSHILSQRRSNLAATSVGGRWAVFGGGTSDVGISGGLVRSDVVDIYDGLNGEWQVATLQHGRCCLGAAGTDKLAVFLAGACDSPAAPQVADVFTFGDQR